jgi:16S rRNA (guanine966-N2)-methyltransferase
MTMRISGGELRSRAVPSPRGAAVRPTPGRVKEALFSIVGERIAAARVLDLYAGSGAIGFEALSRGAEHVVFVEIHAPTAAAIKRTAQEFGLTQKVSVICAPVETAARRVAGRFDLVYADPPYALPPPHLTFGRLRERGAIDSETIVIYERRNDGPPFASPGFETAREANYGETTLQFLKVAP